MARLEDIDEERLRQLAHRIGNASGRGFNDAYASIKSLLQRTNDIPTTDDIRKQLDAIFKYIPPTNKGRSGWYVTSPERRELVTRHSPRLLYVPKRSRRKRK